MYKLSGGEMVRKGIRGRELIDTLALTVFDSDCTSCRNRT